MTLRTITFAVVRTAAWPLAALAWLAPAAAAAAPAGWTCDDAYYADGTCDCGCQVVDSDCPDGTFTVCERSGCPRGQVPWEHSPQSCMDSACGDGWLDTFKGEVCDDGEALTAGGCGAGCKAVNAGWTCGTLAQGCEEAPAEVVEQVAEEPAEATPEASPETVEPAPEIAEATDVDNPTNNTDTGKTDSSGCNGGAASLTALALFAVVRPRGQRWASRHSSKTSREGLGEKP